MSANVNIIVDNNTNYDALEDTFVSEVVKNPDRNVNTVSLKQYGEDYIMPLVKITN